MKCQKAHKQGRDESTYNNYIRGRFKTRVQRNYIPTSSFLVHVCVSHVKVYPAIILLSGTWQEYCLCLCLHVLPCARHCCSIVL